MSGTKDTNWRSYVGNNPDTSGFVNPPNPHDYDDILKFGNCTNVMAYKLTVAAGRENNVDAVRGSGYTFAFMELLEGSGVAAMTLKGSIQGIKIAHCSIGQSNGACEIELGQFDKYWYPGRLPTRDIMIDTCTRSDGGDIRVDVWDAEIPEVFMTRVKIRKIPKLVWFPYFCVRWAWVRIFP
jgi:hypothetical protein